MAAKSSQDETNQLIEELFVMIGGGCIRSV